MPDTRDHPAGPTGIMVVQYAAVSGLGASAEGYDGSIVHEIHEQCEECEQDERSPAYDGGEVALHPGAIAVVRGGFGILRFLSFLIRLSVCHDLTFDRPAAAVVAFDAACRPVDSVRSFPDGVG